MHYYLLLLNIYTYSTLGTIGKYDNKYIIQDDNHLK